MILHELDPKELRRRMDQRLQRMLEEEVEKMVQARHACTEAEGLKVKEFGIDFEATRRALRSKQTTPRAKQIISQLAAGTYPIGRQLKKIGVKVLATCPCCKQAEDNLPHRLWECSALAELREQ